MVTSREVVEGRLVQGVDEQIAYMITTTPWGSAPGTISAKAYDVTTALTDVSATVLSGAASAVGDVITTPVVKSLTEAHLYRIEVKFTCSTNIYECYFEIHAER